jgi:hypothetical protein
LQTFTKIYENIANPCLIDYRITLPHGLTFILHSLVREIKIHVKTLPCLGIPFDNAFKIVEIDTSEIGFGGILKQVVSLGSPKQIVRFHSRSWNNAQSNYSTIKK